MTTTDLAVPEQGGALALPTVTGSAMPGLSGLTDWLDAADQAAQLARQLVHSFFVPQTYKPAGPNGVDIAVANATGAILLGQSLGLDPLTSLQQIYIVHGRPGMYSKMKVALAQREGHRIWEEEYSPERSTWAGQRKGADEVVRITITFEDAKRAGWTSNAAYAKTPADMLAARCSSRVVDRIAADALFGIRSIEDLRDEPAEVMVEPAPRVTATAILAQAVTAEPVPPAADPAPIGDLNAAVREAAEQRRAAVPAEPGVERMVLPVSKGQLDALKTRFEELNLGGRAAAQRAARMRVLSELVGREIDDPRALTNDEAKTCLDNLAGQNGVRVCVDLGVLTDPADEADAEAATSQAHAAAEAEQQAAGDADPYANYDPSLELDGAEAAAEGS